MDDIARELTVSKKTIYKHFKHKKDLVNQIFELTISEEKKSCIQCYEGDDNAIRKMINLSKFVSSNHKEMNPAVLFDLRKYYPSIWKKLEQFRIGFIAESITQNIQEGINEKLYRDNLNSEIIAELYVNLVQTMINSLSKASNNHSFQTLHRNVVYYHLYGICSAAGLEYLEQHINEL